MADTDCVFVVDDDPSARNGLARLLRSAGRDVRPFASVEEFLDDLDPEASGCVVLDARMPGLSANELHAALEARAIYLPIIVVTGDDAPETRRKAREMKAAGFFRKPVDGTALLDAVAWVMRSKTASGNQEKDPR